MSSLLSRNDLEGITETIDDQVKILNLAWDMTKSAREEVLVLFSTFNAFARQEKFGSIELLKEMSSKRKDLKIRILTPKSEHVEEVRLELNRGFNIEIKYIQEFSQTKVSMLIVDRKRSIVVELKNDREMDPLVAIGLTTYSTRIMTVLSYVSIFESYWALSELYEESENELAYTKDYLKKVMNELEQQKK